MAGIILSFFDQTPAWNGIKFEFRGSDGYANVTCLNKALNKRFTDWRKTKFAQELLDELSDGYGIPVDWEDSPSLDQKPLIDYSQGDSAIFVHPAVALSYCMSNPRLQARINMWILNMIKLGTANPNYKDWSPVEYLQGLEFNRDDIKDLYGR